MVNNNLNFKNLSIIIPAKNEAKPLASMLPRLKEAQPNAEIIVVNDGSTDNTAEIVKDSGATLITNPYSMGNGASIKAGARAATGDILITMDADGQHDPSDIPRLINKMQKGYEMVVGARSYESQASKRRWLGNQLYNHLASIIVGRKIEDLTSGFRAVSSQKFKSYLHLLPNGFSYPTTITMVFFRNGFPVTYEPIEAHKRAGKSHLRLIKDGLRFLIIIFKIGTLYSPLKVFFPTSLFFFLAGMTNYVYTYVTAERFTNMSALLFIVSIVIFIMGLIAEQITTLIYSNTDRNNNS